MSLLTMLKNIKEDMLNAEDAYNWINENASGGEVTDSVKDIGLVGKDEELYGKAFMLTVGGPNIYLIVNDDGWIDIYGYEGFSDKEQISFRAPSYTQILD